MAAKAKMKEEILGAYHKYKFIFDFSGITDEKFYGWLHKFETHEEIRKAYTFMFGGGKLLFTRGCLYKTLLMAEKIADEYEPKEWYSLKALEPGHKYVKLLKEICKLVYKTWSTKPKAPRRGSE